MCRLDQAGDTITPSVVPSKAAEAAATRATDIYKRAKEEAQKRKSSAELQAEKIMRELLGEGKPCFLNATCEEHAYSSQAVQTGSRLSETGSNVQSPSLRLFKLLHDQAVLKFQ